MNEEPRWQAGGGNQIRISPALRNQLIGAAAVYIVFLSVFPVDLFKSDHLVWPAANVQVREAEAWLNGSLSLPMRMWDTAVVDGKFYSHFPPFMTLVSAGVMALGPEGVPFNVLSCLFVLPIPGLAYLLFLQRCPTVTGAVILTCAFVLGTSELMVLCRTLQSGKVWQTNHALSQLGLLIFLIDYFGRRRMWLGGLGLAIGVWSRYTMAAYLIPFLWTGFISKERVNRRGQVAAGLWTLVIIGFPMYLNAMKFGSPLETGYALIYEGRDDRLAQDARSGVFSVRFIGRNLKAMNLGFPMAKEIRGETRLVPNTDATGIWWTTPLLLYLFIDLKRIWSQPRNRALLLAVVLIYAALMMFHTTGAAQKGYNRFSLDFLLAMMALFAPYAMEGNRKWITPVVAMWGVCYFAWWIERAGT